MKNPLLFLLLCVSLAGTISAQNDIEQPPSGFSPDGDGVDDTYRFNSVNMKEMKTEIVDAGGVVVFRSEELNGYWDGIDSKGKPAPAGTYIICMSALGLDDKTHSYKAKLQLRRN